MNATVAKIESILKSAYSTKNYVDLVNELFPNTTFVAPDKFRKEFSNFNSYIDGSIHVGNYRTPDKKNIIIMAVQQNKARYVENARSTQRSYAKKLIENANADAAFIAFYTEDNPKWRLSLVRLDYEMKIENGRLKTAENMTPAKRYSYLVGEEEPCHTAISRFDRFITDSLANPEHPTLDDLEEAFSVEKVTNEFFELYCEKFQQLREQLEANEDFCIEAQQHNFTSAQFAKKLMGQIVFLYFLQKKGWLGVKAWPETLTEKEYKNAFFARGTKSRELIPIVYKKTDDNTYKVSQSGLSSISDADEAILAQCVKGRPWGTGPHNFMRRLFEFAEKRGVNFYDGILEPLFYDALNVNRGEQGYCAALHCRIPFLSGGLFEPIDGYDWEHNDFNLPNSIFSNVAEKGTREADGILDIFDRYNFTMSEDEPMEREVAIDPEMLGKVFENLLEVKDRKSKGAFYTPREIVHYMCQESLINYLTGALHVSEEAVRDFILYGDFMKDEDTDKEKRLGNKGMYISEELYKIDSDGKVVVDRLRDMDKALQDVRVADPAVGSGAFPLGMLNEIVRARQNISAYMGITMSAYDKRMMYQLERSTRNLKYETIRNCIFAADIEPSAVDIAQLRLWLSLVIDDEINPDAQSPLDGHKNPLPLPNLECNILCGNSLVDEFEGTRLIKESDILGSSEYQLSINQDHYESVIKELIAAQEELYRCDNTEKKKELLERIRELKDAVILVQLEGCDQDKIDRYMETRNMASKPYVLWQLDFARVFREKGGFDIVIGNPPYVLLQDMPNSEEQECYYRNHYEVASYKIDLYHLMIEKAYRLLSENGVESFITPSNFTTNNYCKSLRHLLLDKAQIKNIVFYDENVFQANVNNLVFVAMKAVNDENIISMSKAKKEGNAWLYYGKVNVKQSLFKSGEYLLVPLTNTKSIVITQKIEENSIALNKVASVNFGMQLRDRKKYPSDVTKDINLITNDHKKCYTGKDIQPFLAVYNGLYCYYNRTAKKGGCWDESAQLAAPKILCRQIGKYPISGVDLYGYPLLNTGFMISQFKEISPYYILGILNTKIIRYYWLQKFSDNRKQFPKIKGTYLESIPIKRSTAIEQKVENTVKKIINCVNEESGINSYIEELDNLVKDIYEIDDNEYQVICETLTNEEGTEIIKS